jgi:hypothetical protein
MVCVATLARPVGTVNWEVKCVRGKAHGLSCQYARNGKLIGTSRMHHGTGVDLWYREDGQLSEERYIHDGRWNGFERWWADERRVWCERHFQQDVVHGIHIVNGIPRESCVVAFRDTLLTAARSASGSIFELRRRTRLYRSSMKPTINRNVSCPEQLTRG